VALGTEIVQSYGELATRVGQLAQGLLDLGLDHGDRVAIVSANHPAYVEALYAIWHAGLAAVPVNAKLHATEISYILAHSGAHVCFAGPGVAPEISDAAPAGLDQLVVLGSEEYERLFAQAGAPLADVKANDLAWLFYTSGTTGQPKGAMLTHGNLVAMSLSYLTDVDRVTPGDAILHAAPMSHGSGLYIPPHILKGATNVIPESGGFDPAEIFELLAGWPGTTMFAAPTMVHRMVGYAGSTSDRHAIENLKSLVYGGGPMYVGEAIAALEIFGSSLVQIYGQGESPMTITVLDRDVITDRNHPRWTERLGSVGTAQSVVEVRVADEDDHSSMVGEVGEILVRGSAVMAGYWQDDGATRAALRGGWLHTGDLGSMDPDGFLTLKDRSKDVIISGGSNIYPREVEEVLLRHDRVEEASVIGRGDPEWGEIIVAYIVGDADDAELDQLCLDTIARFKRPRHYIHLDELPKNNYGKVLKTALRKIDGET
jgi:long-chain acyl-CoA synthetase